MADSSAAAIHHAPEVSRRDFRQLIATAGAAIVTGATGWPLLDSMNPSAEMLAPSSVDLDPAPIVEGTGITAVWQNQPIVVRHCPAAEVSEARDVPLGQLIEPQVDPARGKPDHDRWIVLIGIRTPSGYVPLGNKSADPRGAWGGWFRPCHASQYGTFGRVRQGPVRLNLDLPPYAFESDTKIKIG